MEFSVTAEQSLLKEQVEQAAGVSKVARSPLLPQLSASGDLGRNHQGEQRSAYNTAGNVPTTNPDSKSGTVTVSQELFNLEALNGAKQASRSLAATRSGELDARLQIALATRQQFYALVRAKQLGCPIFQWTLR